MASSLGRGAQVRLDGELQRVARGGGASRLADSLTQQHLLEQSGAYADGSTADGSTITGEEAKDEVLLPGGRFDYAGVADVAAAAGAAAVAPVTATVLRNATRSAYPREIIAHRFFAGAAPQNTLYAAQWAVQHGCRSLETDMRVTADRKIVLYHDSTLASFTDMSGDIATMTYDQIAAADASYYWNSNDLYFSPLRVPLLTDFLNEMQGQVTRFYPEIKAYIAQSDIALMLAPIVAAGWQDFTWMASTQVSDLRYIRETLQNDRVGLLYTAGSLTESVVVEAAALGRMDFSIDKAFLLTNPSYVPFIRSLGCDVAAYTVSNPADLAALEAIGVRRPICERPIYAGA